MTISLPAPPALYVRNVLNGCSVLNGLNGQSGRNGQKGTKRAMSTLRTLRAGTRERAEMVESAQFGYSWHARRGLEARFGG